MSAAWQTCRTRAFISRNRQLAEGYFLPHRRSATHTHTHTNIHTYISSIHLLALACAYFRLHTHTYVSVYVCVCLCVPVCALALLLALRLVSFFASHTNDNLSNSYLVSWRIMKLMWQRVEVVKCSCAVAVARMLCARRCTFIY